MMMIGEQADRRREQLLLFIHVCIGWVSIGLDDGMLDLWGMPHGMEAVAMPRLSSGVATMSGIIGQKEQDRLLQRALLKRAQGGGSGGTREDEYSEEEIRAAATGEGGAPGKTAKDGGLNAGDVRHILRHAGISDEGTSREVRDRLATRIGECVLAATADERRRRDLYVRAVEAASHQARGTVCRWTEAGVEPGGSLVRRRL